MRKCMPMLIKLLEILTLNCSLHTEQQNLDAVFVRAFMNCAPK